MKTNSLNIAILAAGLLIFSTAVNIVSAQTSDKKMEMKKEVKYTCPNHPDVVSDMPGKCKCGADLVAMKEKDNMDMAAKYTCPHHPDVVSDKPGKCKCGAELVVMKKSDEMQMNNCCDMKMEKGDKMKSSDDKEMMKMDMKSDTTMMMEKKMK